MSWFGDVFSFEGNKLGNVLDAYKKDPERAFLGINTPLEGAVWGKVLGKDYTPTVDMYGGATKEDSESAQAKGINTGPGESMHNLARGITSMFAGGYGASQAGLLGGAGGGAADAAGSTAGNSAGNTGLLSNMSSYSKSINPILQSASYGKNLAASQQRPAQASPMMSGQGGGANTMTALYQQGQQYLTPLQQAEMARQQRRQQW